MSRQCGHRKRTEGGQHSGDQLDRGQLLIGPAIDPKEVIKSNKDLRGDLWTIEKRYSEMSRNEFAQSLSGAGWWILPRPGTLSDYIDRAEGYDPERPWKL